MKTPVWILQALLAAALASQGWLVLAVIDLGKQQAAQSADISMIKQTMSRQQITRIERSKQNE